MCSAGVPWGPVVQLCQNQAARSRPGSSPQPLCIACGATEEGRSGSSWPGLHARWIMELEGELGWPRPFTTHLLPKPRVSSEHLTSILQPWLASPLRKHGDRLRPYGAIACFFPVRLTMKNKTPRHSWSSLQWLKLCCAYSKWHENISRTAQLWTAPCSCAQKFI